MKVYLNYPGYFSNVVLVESVFYYGESFIYIYNWMNQKVYISGGPLIG